MSFKKGESGNRSGRPKGAKNKATRALKEFWREFFDSRDYRDKLMRRIMTGKAPHMEKELHHYVYGVPRETLKVEGDVPSFRVVKDDSGDA